MSEQKLFHIHLIFYLVINKKIISFLSYPSGLYQCGNDFLTSTWQHIDDRNLRHSVATWLQTE